MKTLVLWDIDGTLILSGGAGERALVVALRPEFGLDGDLEGIEIAGRTDRWIVRHILAKYGLPVTAENISRFLAGYLRALPDELNNPHSHVLPGVRDLVAALAARGDVAQGLLTGNLRAGAELKLRYHDLWTPFAFGAFADDSELRNALGPHAVTRACSHHSVEFSADRVWVVGDTPHDIECGKVIGACTLAVATGRYSLEELRVHHPTALYPNLTDTAAVLATLTR